MFDTTCGDSSYISKGFYDQYFEFVTKVMIRNDSGMQLIYIYEFVSTIFLSLILMQSLHANFTFIKWQKKYCKNN